MKLLSLASIIITVNQLFTAQSLTLPNTSQIVVNYSPEQMQQHPQNWDAAVDSNNIIYFANSGGVVEFDGLKWNDISLPGTGAYSLLNFNNRIYAGGKNVVGYLVPDSVNKNIFQPVEDSVFLNINYGRVNDLVSFNNNLHIITTSNLIIKSKTSTKIFYPEKKFGEAFIYKDQFYIRDYGFGLKLLKDDKLIPLENTRFFEKHHLMFAVPLENKMLLGTFNEGLYLFDGGMISNFKAGAEEFLLNSQVSHAAILHDGNIAIATRRKGLIIIDKNGNTINYYSKTNGLQDNHIKKIYVDNSNNIWLALNSGISKIEYSSPFNIVQKENVIEGIILSIAKSNNDLFVGTTAGLYSITAEGIKNITGFEFAVWQLGVVNNKLYAAATGSFDYVDGNVKRTILNVPATKFLFSLRHPGLIFVSTRQGFKIINSIGGKWKIADVDIGLVDRILSFYEEGNNLWISTLSNGVIFIKDFYDFLHTAPNIKIPAENLKIYYSSNSPLDEQIHIFDIIEYPLFAASKGIFRYSKELDNFKPDSVFGSQFADGSRGVFNLTKINNETIAIHSQVENFLAVKQNNGKYKLISKPFKRFEKDQVNVIYPDGDFIYFGTNKNVFSYNLEDVKNYNLPFKSLVRKVYINSDSLIYGGGALPKDYKPTKLDFANRNLRFQYAATFYEAEERTEYQYKLEGYDESWCNWKKETQKDYTNLHEGDYTFNVRAKNVYGTLGNTGSYSFKILPPFYRTIWAYLIYAALILSSGYVIVKWRINKLQKDKIRLEYLVDEKTIEVKQQAEKLKELDKIKSRFFANISHEFRTPLTLILGPVEQLLIEDKSKERAKTYSLIHRNSRRLLMLINQLLDLSKLESGSLNLNLSKIDIVKLVREVSSLFESLAAKKNIELLFSSNEINIQIYCDLDKIEKVLINLFSNAFKFTHQGKITSRVELRDQNVIIKISDTGIGIDEDKLEKVFEHFYQADNSTIRSFEGSGIGLSLVKEFVELHGGKIKAESTLNKGSGFIISLPVNNKELSENNAGSSFIIEDESLDFINNELLDGRLIDEPAVEVIQNETITPGKNSILLVDDNADVREYLKEYLQKDFEIIEAGNGKDGLDTAVKIIPDIIISDVMMPVMDGYEFCKKIKTNFFTSHIPVILLTARAGDSSILEGLEYGANDYVIKPFNINILRFRINNLLALRTNLQDKIKSGLLLKPSEIKVSSFDEKFLTGLHNLIEERIDDPELSIEELAGKLFMDRISLYRKIKALTGDSPSVFLRSYRLKRAAQLLEQKSGNVTEIAFKVGFGNSAYFTKCFREQFGRLPSEYLSS